MRRFAAAVVLRRSPWLPPGATILPGAFLMANTGISRPHFFFGSLRAGAVPSGGFGSTASLGHLGYKSPNEKLNIACIGAGGKGRSDIAGCHSENIVAMADPDSKRAETTFKAFPNVPKYTDFRKTLDKEGSRIDAGRG